MKIEEAIKECPLYGVCEKSRIGDNESKCKSGDPAVYASCKEYNPYVALSVMSPEKLEVFGINR